MPHNGEVNEADLVYVMTRTGLFANAVAVAFKCGLYRSDVYVVLRFVHTTPLPHEAPTASRYLRMSPTRHAVIPDETLIGCGNPSSLRHFRHIVVAE